MFPEKNLAIWRYGHNPIFEPLFETICLMTMSIDFPFILFKVRYSLFLTNFISSF